MKAELAPCCLHEHSFPGQWPPPWNEKRHSFTHAETRLMAMVLV